MNNSRGFTLLEMMIAITILAVMMTLTSQTISQSVKSKFKIQNQIDEVSKMRDALRLIEQDINQAFHYRDIELELKEAIKKAKAALNKKKKSNGAKTDSQNPAPPETEEETAEKAEEETIEAPRVDPVTHFIGSNDSLNFVTKNNAALLASDIQADFVEVGYSVKSCKNLVTGQSSQCLYRRLSNIVDLDVEKGGDEIVLLENVEEFTLQYIGPGKQDWVKDWSSKQTGDAGSSSKFPVAVEISLTTTHGEGDKKKKTSMQVVAIIRNPNNPPENAGSLLGGQNVNE